MKPSPFPANAPVGSVRINGKDTPVMVHPVFQAWFSSLQSSAIPQSGSTAQRPVNTSAYPLVVGQDFFDTTLGLKISVKSLNPTVWVNGAGGVV